MSEANRTALPLPPTTPAPGETKGDGVDGKWRLLKI